MPRQNKSENLAYTWLKKNGHEKIFFRSTSSPDFTTDKGNFEIKRGYKTAGGLIKVLFNDKQREKLIKVDATVLVFMDDEEPVEIIKPKDLQKSQVRDVILHDIGSKTKTYYLQCQIPIEYKKKMDSLVKEHEYSTSSGLVTKALKDLFDKHGEKPVYA